MLLSLITYFVAYKTYLINKENCDAKTSVLYIALIIIVYGSHALLFMDFITGGIGVGTRGTRGAKAPLMLIKGGLALLILLTK